MTDESARSSGCLWLGASLVFLVPAMVLATLLWPNQSDQQFGWRTLSIALAFVAVAALGVLGLIIAGWRNRS